MSRRVSLWVTSRGPASRCAAAPRAERRPPGHPAAHPPVPDLRTASNSGASSPSHNDGGSLKVRNTEVVADAAELMGGSMVPPPLDAGLEQLLKVFP